MGQGVCGAQGVPRGWKGPLGSPSPQGVGAEPEVGEPGVGQGQGHTDGDTVGLVGT